MRIFITNLGKYNEGELIWEWVELPVSEEELKEVLEKIGISDEPDKNGNYYEEYFITDYETDIEGVEIKEYSNIDELNELAEEIENLGEEEQKAVQAMLLNGCDFKEALENAENGDFTIYYDCNDMTDVAYQVVEEFEYLNDIPENVAMYFDYEAFGRDLGINGTFYYIDGDYVELY